MYKTSVIVMGALVLHILGAPLDGVIETSLNVSESEQRMFDESLNGVKCLIEEDFFFLSSEIDLKSPRRNVKMLGNFLDQVRLQINHLNSTLTWLPAMQALATRIAHISDICKYYSGTETSSLEKRAALEFIGDAMHMVFGTAKPSTYNKIVQWYKERGTRSDSLLRFESEVAQTLKAQAAGIELHTRALRTFSNEISNITRDLKVITLMNLANVVTDMTVQSITSHLHAIDSCLINGKSHRVSELLLTATELNTSLTSFSHTNRALELGHMGDMNYFYREKIAHVSVLKRKLHITIRVPLILKNNAFKMDLTAPLNSTPLSFTETHYLLHNSKGHYRYLTRNDLAECTKSANDYLICKKRKLYLIDRSVFNCSKHICEIEQSDYAHDLTHRHIIVKTLRSTRAKVICPNNVTHIILPRFGITELPENCRLISSVLVVEAINNFPRVLALQHVRSYEIDLTDARAQVVFISELHQQVSNTTNLAFNLTNTIKLSLDKVEKALALEKEKNIRLHTVSKGNSILGWLGSVSSTVLWTGVVILIIYITIKCKSSNQTIFKTSTMECKCNHKPVSQNEIIDAIDKDPKFAKNLTSKIRAETSKLKCNCSTTSGNNIVDQKCKCPANLTDWQTAVEEWHNFHVDGIFKLTQLHKHLVAQLQTNDITIEPMPEDNLLPLKDKGTSIYDSPSS